MHEVLVNRLGGLSLPRKSVVRLTDRPDMTLDVYRGRKTTNQQQQQGSWVRYPVWQHTFISPSAFSRRAVVSYWRKYVHEVLVSRLGGLSLPRKSVVRLTDRPDMTLDVYHGHKTTVQQQQPVVKKVVKNNGVPIQLESQTVSLKEEVSVAQWLKRWPIIQWS